MRGRHRLQGNRGECRESENQEQAGKKKRARILARKAPAERGEHDRGGRRGNRGAAEGDEPWREGLKGDPRRRQRPAEDDDADESEKQPGGLP